MNPLSGIVAPRPSRASMEGISPLMYSCQQGDIQQVRHLLFRKPSCIKECDRTGKTALHYCAENPTPDAVQLLLKADPDLISQPDEEGYTALHLAVIAGNRTILRYLLDRGADVNALDNERHSVVHWATVCGELEALDLVLEAGADASVEDIHGAYPIHYAAQMCGNSKKLIDSANGKRTGSKYAGLAALKKLIQHGVPVDVTDRDGRQPLLWAASSGSADAILALSNAGASVTSADKDGLTALHCAASRGHCECLETLVALCGAEVDLVDANGCTALFYAVTLGHADCAQLLLDCGADPNHQDKKGRTPAYCGATKGQTETLRLLAQHGADLWLRNVKGDVPLHEAVASGRKDLVLWLLRQSWNEDGQRFGHRASSASTSTVLERHAGQNETVPQSVAAQIVNNDGRSPLHVAAINNNVEMCKILIDYGADVNGIMRTGRGQLITPLDAALRRGSRGCAKFLQLHGGLAAAKLTDSRALQRALNQAYNESQRRVSVMVHQQADGDMYPSLTESQMSNISSMVHLPQLVNGHYGGHFIGHRSRTVSRLEDSATQTQVEESFFSEHKDQELTSADSKQRAGETESGLRRRKIRRRAQQRRSMTEPRPPPNDEELRWKSRQRLSDDSHSETDEDDEHAVRYHPPSRPSMSHFLTESGGGAPDKDRPEEEEETSLNGARLEPLKLNDEHGRSQSIMSNVGTESSGQKDSGFSDLHGRSEEELTLRHATETPLANDEVPERLEHPETIPEVEQGGVSSAESSKDPPPARQSDPETNDLHAVKRTFQLRRAKSERRSEEMNAKPHERIKMKPDIPPSVIRAAQAKTRKYNLERKIFQQLLDLKQMQIRIGQANEQVFAKRLIDSFRKEAVTVGLRPYDGTYSFQQLESYLYNQLRSVQGSRTYLPLVDAEQHNGENNLSGSEKAIPVNKCTHSTQRCPHAMYAYTALPASCYTGVPCAAYLPYHHRHLGPDGRQQHASAGRSRQNTRTILPKLNMNGNNINTVN